MNQNKNRDIWIGVIALVVIGALGLWWLASNQPASTATTDTTATTTADTTTTGDTTVQGTGNPNGSPAGSPAAQVVDRSTESVVAVANSLPGAAQFQSLFSSTGVSAMVTGAGPYTIFVPTDGAVSQLPPGTITNLSAAGKKKLVEYHVVSGRAIDGQAQVAGSIQALSGDALNFSYSANKIPMVNSAILVTEYKAKNGIVYLIDNVLVPPTTTQ